MKRSCVGLAVAFSGISTVILGQSALFTDASEAAIPYATGHHQGIAVADTDGDGYEDFYVTEKFGGNHFYHNLGDGTFEELASEANAIDSGFTMTALWFDYDNDGDPDLYTGNHLHPNRFFRNDGGLAFTELTASADGGDSGAYALLAHTGQCRSIQSADIDNDGWLDLYVTNMNGPNGCFRNLGEDALGEHMGFEDFIWSAGAFDNQVGLGSVFFDADNDGDQDLYLVHDANQTNKFYRNNGTGQFTEVADEVGLDYSGNCMGVDVCDVNHDGWLDLYVSDLFPSALFLNDGDGTFTEVAEEWGVDDSGMTWGIVFTDYNRDSHWDLYVVNDWYFAPDLNILYKGLASGGGFSVVSLDDPVLERPFSDYGLAQCDFDRDGDMDLLIGTPGIGDNPGVSLLRNEVLEGHWIGLNLEGTVSNRDAVGARATVFFAGESRMDEVNCGQGYASQSTLGLYFGLGETTVVDSVVIEWPAGDVETIVAPMVDDWIDVVEGGAGGESGDGGGEPTLATHSIARVWNEALLHGVRHDWARPTVHSRNLWHSSIILYDAWAAFDPETDGAPQPYLLGNTVGEYLCPFDGVVQPQSAAERVAGRRAAISYGMYRLMRHRFSGAPQVDAVFTNIDDLMIELGYDTAFVSMDYGTGELLHDAAALGNYLAAEVIGLGLQDGSNEAIEYQNTYYNPINWSLVMAEPGNPNISFPNRWQQLQLTEFIDQGGNPGQSITPEFLGPEWGNVQPFALTEDDLDVFTRFESVLQTYKVYHDPGPPAYLDINAESDLDDSGYKWGHTMTAVWSSHLDPEDGVMWDISPGAMGFDGIYPTTESDARAYYDFENGGMAVAPNGSTVQGHALNPVTGAPYPSNVVPRGDFARVLAEFWADGPDSETPPGHWFTVMNYVNDQPEVTRKWRGEGTAIDTLQWDVMGYFTLAGAMHDAAITAWGCKGWYDFVRPVSAIRWMADQGQCSDPELPNFDGTGLPLVPGVIELVTDSDPAALQGENGEHIDKLKMRSWRGPDYIEVPETDVGGVGWIRTENWWPYQRPTFVTPPFAGYVSGHSTFSRAAAEVLTLMTGDPFFPGGVGEFEAPAGEFLVFEDGPSVDVTLQWATYRDAADQSALSRIWGGIHPPLDDYPGRAMGVAVGVQAFHCAEAYMLPLLASGCGGNGVVPNADCLGDFNGDGIRAVEDLLMLLIWIGQSNPGPIDLNGDGLAGTGDLLVLLSLWGQPCL